MSYFLNYQCSGCQKEYDIYTTNFRCVACSDPLLAVYDLYKARKELQGFQNYHFTSIWGFEDLLPIKEQQQPVSLGEGNTPIYRLERIAKSLNVQNIFLKQEANNPGGSMRDREMSVLISAIQPFRYETCFAESVGTASVSFSMYCAAAQQKNLLMTSETFPEQLEQECREFGTNVKRIPWTTAEREKMREMVLASSDRIFDQTEQGFTFRIEGAKTIFYELFLQFHRKMPDVLVLPLGDGVLVMGLWKALSEFKKLGFLKNVTLPKIWLVQSSKFPALSLFMKQLKSEIPEVTDSIAADLYCTNTVLYPLISKILNTLSLNIIHIEDDEMIDACKRLARKEGIQTSVEGGACMAAVQQLISLNQENTKQNFLIINPSSGIRRAWNAD